MIGVDVWEVIDGVRNPVTRAALKKSIVGVEDLPGDDDVPLSQQTSSILSFLTY